MDGQMAITGKGRQPRGTCRRAAEKLVGRYGKDVDPVLKQALYVAADEVDRARREQLAPTSVAYVNRDMRDAHSALVMAMGGGEVVDPFEDINDALRAAAVGHQTD